MTGYLLILGVLGIGFHCLWRLVGIGMKFLLAIGLVVIMFVAVAAFQAYSLTSPAVVSALR